MFAPVAGLQNRRKYTFGFYIDKNRNEAGRTDLKAFRLEFFDRHMPAYAEWSRSQSATWNQRKFGATKDITQEVSGGGGSGHIVTCVQLIWVNT